MNKIIIAGGRNFSDYNLLFSQMEYFTRHMNSDLIEIVSGRCSSGIHTFTTSDGIKVYGADGLGERYAKENSFNVVSFAADWNKYGTAAGPIRNKEAAEYATHAMIFWDGRSKGTKSMISFAKKYKLKTEVIIT